MTAGGPGRMVIRATATDADGLTSTTETILKIKNPDDTTAPIIAFDGSVNGGVIVATSAIRATILDTDLDHWTLEIAHAGSDSFVLLASGATPLPPTPVPLMQIDPSGLSNGFYRLKLTAEDVAGRRAVTEAIVEVHSTTKTQQFTRTETDLTVTLDGHVFNLVRQYDSLHSPLTIDHSTFGSGWRLVNRDVNLETDASPLTPDASRAAFRVGTRLYLTLPTGERVGYTFAPVQQTVNGVTFYTPAFTPDASPLTPNVYTLQALETKLTKAGDRFFDFRTGEAYNPTNPSSGPNNSALTLTGPDGTIYKIHAVNGITEQQFTDGKKFILSDSGITALNGESIQFTWTSSPLTPHASRLTSVTGPDGHRIVYTYDQQGNLVSARDLITGDTSRYGYSAVNSTLNIEHSTLTIVTRTGQTGQVIQYPATPATPATPQILPIKADLGAALTYLATPFTSTLTPGLTDRLAFTVRPSELNATNSGDVYIGVIVEADPATPFTPAIPSISGLTPVASNVNGSSAFGLFRVEREGLYLLNVTDASPLTPHASRNYSVKLFIAGDANRDTKVDALDASLIEAALGTTAGAIGYTPLADFDQNGRIDSTDIHLYRQDLGFIPNQAPALSAVEGPVKTHIDLEVLKSVDQYITDQENDPVFYRITGATHGTARIASDGSSVSFTPTTGFFGTAGFSIVADDDYSTSQVATVTVNVSDAPLVKLDFTVRQPRIDARHSTTLELVGDFTDEQNVALPASYLTVSVSNPTAGSLTSNVSRFTFNGLANGTGVITATTAHGPGGVTLQAATAFSIGIPTDQTQQFLYALGLDVFPGAVSLAEGGGQRQILADLADTIQLTNGSTGTRYFVSNPNVVTVSADGLITAGQVGDAIVTVINGPAESLIPVKVEVPHVGPTVLGNAGGVVQGADGSLLAVAPGSITEGTLVSLAPITEASLPAPVPGPFQFGAAFTLDVGADQLTTAAQLAIPIGSTFAPGTRIYFFRHQMVSDGAGGQLSIWMQEEFGTVGSDGMARTNSDPFPGVLNSGSWIVAAASGLGEVGGFVSTFFPNAGAAIIAAVQLPGGLIGQFVDADGNFTLGLPSSTPSLAKFIRIANSGGVQITDGIIPPVLAGQRSTFSTTIINPVDSTTLTDPPAITSAQLELIGGVATLVLTGERFTYSGSSISAIEVNFDVPFQGGKQRVTASPASGSTSTELRAQIPAEVVVGIADISVTRPKVGKVDAQTSAPIRLAVEPHFVFAANLFESIISVVDVRSNSLIKTIQVGDGAANSGPRSIAISSDKTRAYVSLRNNQGIAVLDTQTLQEVDVDPAAIQVQHKIVIPNATPYWVVADKQGKFLYVSDQHTNLIYVVSIDPTSPTFHTHVGTIVVNPAAFGLRGMDISADGTRLYVAAPGEGALVNLTSRGSVAPGKILVVDTDFRQGNNQIWQQIGTIDADQEPYYVQASSTDPKVITFANRRSEGLGFGVIHANDSQTAWSRPTYTALTLGSIKDTFDVNDASSIVILPAGTFANQLKDYAFVTGWNRIIPDDISRDPFLIERTTIDEIASVGLRFRWQVGGNVGVIEDPFGPNPQLIAATEGEQLGMPEGLTLSGDGKFLYAAFSANNQVEVFSVQKILNTIQAHRNDPPFNTLREGPKPVLSMNPLESFDPSIRLGRINVGRFPADVAIAEILNVQIGFGRTNEPVDSTQILVQAEAGEITPIFRWKVDWPSEQLKNAATSKIYLSVFPEGQGLFPDDRPIVSKQASTPDEDPNSHRILNGVSADHKVEGNEDVFELDLGTLEPARKLTLGQTYYIGVEVRNENGVVLQRATHTFKLEQPPVPQNATTFSSVTILTHGFEPPFLVSDVPKVFFELANHIADAGGGGIVAKYRILDGKWITLNGAELDLSTAATAIGKPLVLIPDWITESRISDSGFAEAAGDAIFASLVQLNNDLNGKIFGTRTDGVLGPIGPQAPIHFIGHSRGAVVNSEIIQRLGTVSELSNVRVQMTTLDPHDFNQSSLNIDVKGLVDLFKKSKGTVINVVPEAKDPLELIQKVLDGVVNRFDLTTISYGDFQDPNVQRWANVTFADNYFQTAASSTIPTFTPNGRAIDGFDINIPLSGLDGFSNVPARAGFTRDDIGIGLSGISPLPDVSLTGFGGTHSRVWRWYAGTTDLNITEFGSTASGDSEAIFRRSVDRIRAPFDKVEVPWYDANGFTIAGADTPWEGIQAGWFFSPQGGGQPTSIITGVPVSFNNTEGPHGIDPAVPSIFNGNFEYGNLHTLARFPTLVLRDSLSTPGWSFHGGSFVPASRKDVIKQDPGTGNYAAELNSFPTGSPRIEHNRFYIPTNAQSVEFWSRVEDREFSRTGTVKVLLLIEGGAPQEIGSFLLGAKSSQYERHEFSLNNSPLGNVRGKTGSLIFELSYEGQIGPQSNVDKVWLDDIRLVTAQPLQAEQAILAPGTSEMLSTGGLVSAVEAARSWWTSLVEMPNGIAGGNLGSVLVAANNLTGIGEQPDENSQTSRNAGFGESGLDDQGFLANISGFTGITGPNEMASIVSLSSADQFLINGDASLATDGHTVDSKLNSRLASKVSLVVDTGIRQIDEALVVEGGALVDDSTIRITDFNSSLDAAVPGSEGTSADLQVLNLEKVPLLGFISSDGVRGQLTWGEGVGFVSTAELNQSEEQNNQRALQHNLSFGTLTVPPDRDSVNTVAGNGQWSMANGQLTAEQLDLLSRATVTLADLADGYLALTLGTTITLDTDAAGYGWFIDPTPFTNEEFVNGGSMVEGQWSIGSDASPWQFMAKPGSAAEGHIDLMTVLMHELGHVMGLGHVSSAVDSTRLMAGSIDPGIRRLPSSLDLGLDLSLPHGHAPDASPLTPHESTIWAPYLAHYTSTNYSPLTIDHSLPAVNPARLVQASQTPPHEGILNGNFASPEPVEGGWDESGAVTIANGQAVLSEDNNVISTLSQLFTLPAGSTHLRFTLVDVNLSSNVSPFTSHGPQDAFEVALLESSTLTPLAGVTAGLTQTDSLFNLQQDGTVRFSNRASLSNGTLSGSTLDLTQPIIVDIDLTGITAGAGARLSFDLLGFGDRTSSVTIDNVLLTNDQPTATPFAVNDTYTAAEGMTLDVTTFGLLTNDTDIDSPQADLSVALATGPLQGTLTVNADGSFTYVHNGSETLTDSFTYRVSDGINFSNLATVSLTITPVNDTPVMAAIAPQTENRGATLTFTAVATDPDLFPPDASRLTFTLGSGAPTGAAIDPVSGVFTWAVPVTQPLGATMLTVRVTDAGTPALFAERTVSIDVQPLLNQAPVLTSIGAKSVNEQTELRFTIFATDLDIPAQILTYSATPLPPGATFTPATGEFFWTPAEDQGGASYQVTFSQDGVRHEY